MYAAPVVQILAVSNRIGRNPFKWPKIAKKLGNACFLVVIHKMMASLREKWSGAILDDTLGARFTKKPCF